MSKRTIYIVGFFVVVIALSGFTWWFHNNAQALQYRNDQYGFTFALPQDWKGYTTLDQTWSGDSTCPTGGQCGTESGPEIVIRNPNWTADKPWQDIPIMVFTLDQWNAVKQGTLITSAAPVPPTELGSNAQYIFALPARYNYAYPEGYQEVEDILKNNPLSVNEPTNSVLIPAVSAAKVPKGWYSHHVAGIDAFDTVLTKTKDLPKADPNNYGYGEHIAIVERDIALTPDQYLKGNLNVDESNIQFSVWSTLFGRKMFSVGFTNPNDGSKEQSIYLFSDGYVVMVNIYPDTQANHSAFEQVVNYYAQNDPSLPMISRAETVAACKSVNLPPRKEYDMTADPETGYVTVIYRDASGTEHHVFFNYRDDASQCTPSVKALLESITGQGPALLP